MERIAMSSRELVLSENRIVSQRVLMARSSEQIEAG
jgi:hypothetical protein